MKTILTSLFPTILRLDREKNSFDKVAIYFILSGYLFFSLYSYLVQNIPLSISAIASLEKSIAAYIGYLIILELAPDFTHIYSRCYLILLISLIFSNSLQIIPSIFFLIVIRMLVKASGYISSYFELVLVLTFTLVAYLLSDFNYPLVLSVALILDYKFKHKDDRNLIFIFISAFMAGLWFFRGFGIMANTLSVISTLTVLIIGIIFIFRLSLLKSILTFNDLKSNMISPKRVKAAGLILLLSLLIMAIGHGRVIDFFYLWVALGCISIPFLGDIKKLV